MISCSVNSPSPYLQTYGSLPSFSKRESTPFFPIKRQSILFLLSTATTSVQAPVSLSQNLSSYLCPCLLLLLSRFSRVQLLRPHRQQPTRFPRPWDSPGKNTGVGCHFLLQRMKVKSESEVAQSCPTLSDLMDSSLPGSSSMGFSSQEYWSGLPLPSPTSQQFTQRQRQLLQNINHIMSLKLCQ